MYVAWPLVHAASLFCFVVSAISPPVLGFPACLAAQAFLVFAVALSYSGARYLGAIRCTRPKWLTQVARLKSTLLAWLDSARLDSNDLFPTNQPLPSPADPLTFLAGTFTSLSCLLFYLSSSHSMYVIACRCHARRSPVLNRAGAPPPLELSSSGADPLSVLAPILGHSLGPAIGFGTTSVALGRCGFWPYHHLFIFVILLLSTDG